MTMHVSPTIGDGDMWSGGGARPWWDFPTPLGVPKSQIHYGCSYEVRYAPTGEPYEVPVSGGILWPWSDHKIKADGSPGWCDP